MKKRIVIKISGSVFDPERKDLIEKFAVFLTKISSICQPVAIAGGGKIARHYIEHARASGADESTLDELGIEISRLNAKLLICALGGKAYTHTPTTLREVQHAIESKLVVVTGGLHPGQSTNGTAALIAEKIRAVEFLNATDVDGVYNKDPKIYKNAKKLKKINLSDLRSMLAHEDTVAGGYDLMDIVALKIIERSRIKTRILEADTTVLERVIKGDAAGTEIIHSKKKHTR
ncbi:MAG: uridylate kinase [Cenarchaeum symbiont of Oopsacas minuta]|nr:uridylate kinase [Cenarchaeum symbiont of Oopsacas minuta]